MSKYYSINEFSKILGVSAQTLRNWDNKGKLHPHHTSSNGYRYYSHEQLNQVMNITNNNSIIVSNKDEVKELLDLIISSCIKLKNLIEEGDENDKNNKGNVNTQ